MKRYLFLVLLALAFACNFAWAASGSKTPAGAPRFHNLSSSTKPSISGGEMQYNAGYLFINISSAIRPHWRRIGLGASF